MLLLTITGAINLLGSTCITFDTPTATTSARETALAPLPPPYVVK